MLRPLLPEEVSLAGVVAEQLAGRGDLEALGSRARAPTMLRRKKVSKRGRGRGVEKGGREPCAHLILRVADLAARCFAFTMVPMVTSTGVAATAGRTASMPPAGAATKAEADARQTRSKVKSLAMDFLRARSQELSRSRGAQNGAWRLGICNYAVVISNSIQL